MGNDREAARRAQCACRTENGGCERVNAKLGWPSMHNIDECDSCHMAGPDTPNGELIRQASADRIVRLVVQKGLAKCTPPLREAILHHALPAPRAKQVLLGAAPMLDIKEAESHARRLGGDKFIDAVRERVAWGEEQRADAAAMTPCARRRLLKALGEAGMSALRGESPLLVKPVERPTVSICIASRDEGIDLEHTITSALASKYKPKEIIVVDDGSEEHIDSFTIGSLGDRVGVKIQVHRFSPSIGAGPAKHHAAAQAIGDLVVVCDSHMRFPWKWLDEIVEAHKRHPTAILWPSSVGFDDGGFHGKHIEPKFDPDRGAWVGTWAQPDDDEDCQPTFCPMGGCYVIPKVLLPRLGGYAPLLQSYGHEEEWLGWRAWLSGCEVRCVRAVKVAHQYQRPVSGRHNVNEVVNYARVARLVHGAQVYRDVYRPFFAHKVANLDSLVETDQLRAFELQMVAVQRRGVQSVMDVFGMAHPRPLNV